MAAASIWASAGVPAAALPGKMKGIAAPRVLYWLLSLAVALAAAGTPAAAAVYKVGDESGWNIVGDVNYAAWASSKTFRVGDVVVFEYNKEFHNVMEVSKADYRACSARSPMATHTSGNDTIALKRRGHRFFICGVAGHCASGQKVDIRVARLASAAGPAAAAPSLAASSPAALPPPPASGGPAAASAPAPRKNVAARRVTGGWALALLGVAAVAAARADLG